MKIAPLLLVLSFLFALLTPVSTNAQSATPQGPVCPPPVLLTLGRAGAACYTTERNQVCYGSGTIETTLYLDTNASDLSLPGDRTTDEVIQSLRVRPPQSDDAAVSVAVLNVKGSLAEAEQRMISMLLIGDAVLDNLVPPIPRQILTARAIVNIRRLPDQRAEIVSRIQIAQTLTANGISEDGAWLRVNIPNSSDLGWVGVDVVASDGNVRQLATVDALTPLFRPFEVARLESNPEFALCDGALLSGLLLQTPNVEDTVELTLNDQVLTLAGTFFIQASEGVLKLNALEGSAGVGAAYVPAGAQFDGATVSPYDAAALAGLPLNNLPRRALVTSPITVEEIAALTALREAQIVQAAAPTPEPTPDSSCRRMTVRTTTLWAGPGSFYESINELPEGRFMHPVRQTTDADGEVWWQLSDSNWVRARLIEETGDCAPVPVVDRAAPPRTNTLSLESCQTLNGPLRSGQQVRIEFTPAAFDNWGEARDAARIDPGRIIINQRTHYTQATEAIRIGSVNDVLEDRYVRTFFIYWTATPGTYRIEGDRLHYKPSCSITVPVG